MGRLPIADAGLNVLASATRNRISSMDGGEERQINSKRGKMRKFIREAGHVKRRYLKTRKGNGKGTKGIAGMGP